MDTSEQYIKQCEKAEEIQKLSPCKDWLDIDFTEEPYYSPDGNLWLRSVGSDGRIYTWLPHQDQLQEMMRFDAITLAQLLNEYITSNKLDPTKLPQPSMEQLWLAFVMREKYNKIWDGSEWAKV